MSALGSRPALVVLFALGVGLMIPFEEWYTRLAGMTCLIGFIVLGVFLIAEPGFLSPDEDES